MTPQHVISQLLASDKPKYPGNIELLKKILMTAYLGRLEINGLPPDNKVSFANYLFDNERVIFDFTRLSESKKQEFLKWLLESHQIDKITTYLGGVTTNEYRGFTSEVYLTWWGRLINWFNSESLDHWKINDLDLSLKNISHYQLNGIDICHGEHGISIGFNQFLVPGTGSKYRDPNDTQQEPLGNTKRVFITDQLVDKLQNLNLNNFTYEKVCKGPHPYSIEVTDQQARLNKMYDYRKMQSYVSLKPWYIRMWSWIFPWLRDEQTKSKVKSGKEKHVIPLFQSKTVEVFQFAKSQEILVREKKPNIENIVFCGGGAKIFAHIGVCRALDEANIRPKKFAGSSAGAIIALMCYLGYTAQEIEELFNHFKHEHIVHFDLNINGLSEPRSLKTALDFAIANKLSQIVKQYNIPYPEGKITYATLDEIRKKCPGCGIGDDLLVTATNKTQRKTRIFSLAHSPNFEVSESVKTSASFPILYRSTLVEGEDHSDGGILNNLPTDVFIDDHSTFLESEYGNNLKVLAVQFNEGPERKAIDRVMEKVYRENIVLNWIYGLLTGVSDPASGWEKDRLKLRKYACQSIVININNVSSTSFNVSDESKKNMINEGYKETKNYLEMRYHKTESGDYENEEYMYATFSSLGELLSYCCYRGDKTWFDEVCRLIDESSDLNRAELMQQAKELRNIYFSPRCLSPKKAKLDDNPITFFGNEIPQDSSLIAAENHKILLGIYPIFLKLTYNLLRDSKDRQFFEKARHSLSLKSPFDCLKFFDKIKNEIHVVLHIIINFIKELQNNPSDQLYQALNHIFDILKNVDNDMYQDSYYARWDLSLTQCYRVLNLLKNDIKNPNTYLLQALSRNYEPLKTVIAGVFYEDYNDMSLNGSTTSFSI